MKTVNKHRNIGTAMKKYSENEFLTQIVQCNIKTFNDKLDF